MLATYKLDRILSNTKMAAMQHNLSKMVSGHLRNKANEFLNSRKHANNLADILQMFEVSTVVCIWSHPTYNKFTFRLGTLAIAYLTWISLLFQAETDNYTPLLLTIEVIFTELLKRGDLIQTIVPLKPIGKFCFVFCINYFVMIILQFWLYYYACFNHIDETFLHICRNIVYSVV